MGNGLTYKVFSVGGQQLDAILFGFISNDPALDLAGVDFNTRFFLRCKEEVGSMNELNAIRNLAFVARLENGEDLESITVRATEKEGVPIITAKGPLIKADRVAAEKIGGGAGATRIGSLIARSVHAASTNYGNLFLHGVLAYNPTSKDAYLILSESLHGMGKSTIALEFLSHGYKLLTNSLRLKIRTEGSYAMPQNYPSDNASMLLRPSELAPYEREKQLNINDLGIYRESNERVILGPDHLICRYTTPTETLRLEDYNVHLLVPLGMGHSEGKDHKIEMYPIERDELIPMLIGSWESNWRFKGKPWLIDTDMREFDDVMLKHAPARKNLDQLVETIRYAYTCKGNVFRLADKLKEMKGK